ncbi:hydantoinase/oxoprolinase N-terminal domain-containing protein [Ostreibacterium oceani]|uniref:Hydantoinase/oxoprolinase family protein n=1 Tax=Ostreibacterium oceani TaxID=2654998 RepID=A0A6N7EVR9_9GAMM|nr:hydantoinase/oxoprolinase family protein [Ostreibacterium oceani]MPV85177.1 hydantoinase/oxoprolinase family protein [Ostreibacterium oceani]
MAYSLGIDTGGTYTDAVLLSDDKQVIATAKSLTTRHCLADGIRQAIKQLPTEYLTEIKLVSLSTTLATNAVVEEQGNPVLGLFAGYSDKQLARVKIPEIIGQSHVHIIQGGHSAAGKPTAPLDLDSARRIIEKNHAHVSAIAISSMFSVRNTEHEKALQEMIQSICDKPVTCGYELSRALDAPRRALTSVLNARLISFTKELITSVEAIKIDFGINAPLMIVKGDGTLINAKTAQKKPVETILSGPAASVMGAALLSGKKNLIVADMGGTTTDIAIIRDGQPKINAHGAKVGNWSPMVNAIAVHAVGLGGDSEVKFGGSSGKIAIGPRRVMPMSLLCDKHPEVIAQLTAQNKLAPSTRSNRFAVPLYTNALLQEQLDDEEMRAWETLQKGPLEIESLVVSDNHLARAVARLQRKGMVLYSGFTPSDAAHVLGKMSHWSVEGAEIGAKIWIKQMRRVYGLGTWEADDIQSACQAITDRVIDCIANTLITVALDEGEYQIKDLPTEALAELIGELLWGKNKAESLFDLNFARDYHLVAVGGPVASFYPQVSQRIHSSLIMPEHAAVSNAIGAVATNVKQTVSITITEAQQGVYRVHAFDIIKDFEDYEQAITFAQQHAGQNAEASAKAAGAISLTTTYHIDENRVNNSIDGDVFFEATVTATAEGLPA